MPRCSLRSSPQASETTAAHSPAAAALARRSSLTSDSLRKKGQAVFSASSARSRSRMRGADKAWPSAVARLMASLIALWDALNVAIAFSSDQRRTAFI
jgi:hypothetical protein